MHPPRSLQRRKVVRLRRRAQRGRRDPRSSFDGRRRKGNQVPDRQRLVPAGAAALRRRRWPLSISGDSGGSPSGISGFYDRTDRRAGRGGPVAVARRQPRAARRGSGAATSSRSSTSHRREKGVREGSPLRIQRRQADLDRDAEFPSVRTAAGRRRSAARAIPQAADRHRPRALQARSGDAVNVGNVAEFGFDDSGDWLAYTIDAHDQIGNGVQLRNMRTDVVRAIDSDRALYRHLAWSDSGHALAVLRGRPDSARARHAVLRRQRSPTSRRPRRRRCLRSVAGAGFPGGHEGRRRPRAALRRRLSAPSSSASAKRRSRPTGRVSPRAAARDRAGRRAGRWAARSTSRASTRRTGESVAHPLAREGSAPPVAAARAGSAGPRLQLSRRVSHRGQQVRAPVGRRAAHGERRRPRSRRVRRRHARVRQTPSYSGRSYEDVYGVDLATGAAEAAAQEALASAHAAVARRQGADLLGRRRAVVDRSMSRPARSASITKGVPTVFADTSDDHNNIVHAADPAARLVEGRERSAALRRFDVWKVPVNGGDGGEPHRRRQEERRSAISVCISFERRARGAGGRAVAVAAVDAAASRTASTSRSRSTSRTYGEWTKKEGLAEVEPASRARRRSCGTTPSTRSRRRRTRTSTSTRSRRRSTIPNYYVRQRATSRVGAPDHRRESAAEGVRLDERREADQLHERQGRQAAGRAVPAGELRAGQEVSDARHDLREALAISPTAT